MIGEKKREKTLDILQDFGVTNLDSIWLLELKLSSLLEFPNHEIHMASPFNPSLMWQISGGSISFPCYRCQNTFEGTRTYSMDIFQWRTFLSWDPEVWWESWCLRKSDGAKAWKFITFQPFRENSEWENPHGYNALHETSLWGSVSPWEHWNRIWKENIQELQRDYPGLLAEKDIILKREKGQFIIILKLEIF